MANPKRVPFKNIQQMKLEYRIDYYTWFGIGAVLSWPLACMVGYRAQRYQGGVGVVPYQRWVEDWPNVTETRQAQRWFRRYAFYTCILGGFAMATYMSDNSKLRNSWYTRPDFKQKAAMVKDESMIYDEAALKQLYQQNYNASSGDEKKKGDFYRVFRPLNADYNTVDNHYAGREHTTNFRALEAGKFPTLHHDYSDHEA